MLSQETNPLVSIIIPAYNAEKYLVEAVRSILQQTYANLEVIIVNDGSYDKTSERVLQLQAEDKRVVVLEQAKAGIAAALDVGIGRARGEFIARMDADDIAYPERIEKQVRFLLATPEVAVLSAGYRPFRDTPSSSEETVLHPPLHEQIYALLAFCSPLCHPCVMARAGVFREFSYHQHVAAEDHELWCRCIKKYRFANLEEPLLYYRRHETSVTARKRRSIRWGVLYFGLKHLFADRQRYLKSLSSLGSLDRSHYRTINWRPYDCIERLVRWVA